MHTAMDNHGLQALRHPHLRVAMMSLANAVLQAVVLALFAWEGDVPLPALATFVPLALGVPLAFALLIHSGWSGHLEDPALLVPQAAAGCGLQLAFLLVAPQLSVLFLVGALVTYNLLIPRMKPRQLTTVWLLLGTAVGVTLWLVRDRFRYPGVDDLGLYALWLYFFLSMCQFTVSGVHGGALRSLLTRRKAKRSQALPTRPERSRDEALRERERISREMHDTLLQGVQGLVLRFQTAADSIPPDLPARRMMDEALERADQVLVEGRDRVVALQLANDGGRDLVEALSSTGEDLSLDFGTRFRLEVLGERRPVQHEDEFCRIVRDVIVDAFQHPAVQEVAVQLQYGSDGVDVRVLDDGGTAVAPGADPLRRGTALAALEDRVCRVGGRLSVSRAARGGQICLWLRAAYASTHGPSSQYPRPATIASTSKDHGRDDR